MAEHRTVPMPDAVTATQVDTLLRTAGTLMGLFLNPYREAEIIPGKNEPPPEARIAAEVTFSNVCDRLDTILKDDSRWSMEFHKKLAAQMDEIHSNNIGFLQHQAAASKELVSPHFRYRPNLHRMPDANWVAFLGDLDGDPESVIAGIGNTPAAAIAAFDNVFSGSVPKHMVDWLVSHEKAINSGQPSPEIPNYEKSMDKRRNNPRRKAQKSRAHRARNRKRPRSDV